MSARDVFNGRSPADLRKIAQRREAINKPNRHGTNMFFQAVESGKLGDVAQLLDEGADINARTTQRGFISSWTVNIPYSTGATPLHAACLLGQTDIVSYLLRNGADVNAKDDSGHTPMDYALLSHGYFENELDKKEQSLFTFQRTVDKAAARVAEYNSVITQLLRHKGRPGMFELPEQFKSGPDLFTGGPKLP
ncbi:MAG TPA: ankyrin repeat domain-containing protein [Patescibacteria group bacterium]|nr:ankyrin repeat domain-containing protein [Patescibacteria group bacterium]